MHNCFGPCGTFPLNLTLLKEGLVNMDNNYFFVVQLNYTLPYKVN